MARYDAIPQEIKLLSQWVCWQAYNDESRPGHIKKVPINPRTGGQAQSNNPDTWTDYNTAFTASEQYSGIGFMFGNGYFGVDLDGIDDAIEDFRTGDPDNIVAEFVHTLQSYAEYSVSGRGVHVICKGALPPRGRRKNNVEMYSEGRFFTMTGNIVSEYKEIADCTERIKLLHEKYIGGGTEPTTGIVRPSPTLSLSDEDIIRLAGQSKQGQMFQSLYRGEWEQYFQSQSEADMSLCNMLAFWCQKDEAKMDRLFRSSGLMRDKWDRRQSGSTYGALTIHKAASSCARVYEREPEYRIYIGAPPPPEQRKIYSFDDTGNAQRFNDRFKESIRYSYKEDKWYYYDGRRWCIDFTGVIARLIDECVEEMRADFDYYMENIPENADGEDYEKQFFKHLKTSRSNRGHTAMRKEAEHYVPILPEDFDQHNSLLNTPNGIINLRTGELQAHDAAKFMSKITAAEYTDKMDCPMWESFLIDIFNGDMELIAYIKKAIGYSISGSTQEQCAFFCYGGGLNGKSTFLETISAALGDYARNVQPETLMIKNQNNSASSDIARLKGARFVTSPEPNDGTRLNEGLIKQLTGGDKVTARKLYSEEMEFAPEFKLWMGTNHKPVIRGTDTGIWRRVHLIPFTVQIPENKVDKSLKHKLKKEAPGILRWAVEGCLRWQKEGLQMPEAVREAVNEYRREMDVTSAFLSACTVMSNGREKALDLYKAYAKWAEENNEYKMSATKFGTEMSKKYSKEHNRDGWSYTGLTLHASLRPYGITFQE